MQVFEVSGTAYEMGREIGHRFRRVLQRRCAKAEEKWMNEEMRAKLSAIAEKLEKTFPEALQEIRGKAEGAGVSFFSLLLLNSPELTRKSDGCTTVILKDSAGRVFFSHNEDEDNFFKNNTMLVRFNYPDHWVVGYTNAEKVIGSCFGFNSYGLLFSSNFLFPDKTDPGEISRYIYERWLTSASGIAEVRSRLQEMKVASPFSFNVVDTGTGEAFNFEKDLDRVYETEITAAYGRSNHFLAKEGEVKASPNSLFRAAKAQEGINGLDPRQASGEKMREILCYQGEDRIHSIFLTAYNDRTVANLCYNGADGSLVIRDYLDHNCDYNLSFPALLRK